MTSLASMNVTAGREGEVAAETGRASVLPELLGAAFKGVVNCDGLT